MAIEHFPIESGHIMAFARALGDLGRDYDETAIAPPTFVQASAHYDRDYPLRPRPGVAWFGSGREPSGAGSTSGEGSSDSGGTGLHAEQHYEYHRPVRAGDVLTVETKPGNRWEKQGRRAGILRFIETITEYRNQDGQLVVTTRSVGVMTEKPVEG